MRIDCKINLIFTSNIYWRQKIPTFLLRPPFPPSFPPYIFSAICCRTLRLDGVTGQHQWRLIPATLLLLTPNTPRALVLKVESCCLPREPPDRRRKRERSRHRAAWLCKKAKQHIFCLWKMFMPQLLFFFSASSGISMKILQTYNLMGKGGWLSKVVVVKSSKMKRIIWGKRRRAPF